MISIARTFGAPDTVPAGNVARSASNASLPGASVAGDVAHDVHDVAVVLDLHELVDADRPRRRDAAQVVAAQVDEHDVLGSLLLVGEQVGAQAAVLGGVTPRGRVPGERAREHLVALHAHERLGARADERHVAGADVEHVRARVHGAQHAVEVQPVALVRRREALREHDLEDVARRDVLLGALAPAAMNSLARRVRLQRHRHAQRRTLPSSAPRGPDVDALAGTRRCARARAS